MSDSVPFEQTYAAGLSYIVFEHTTNGGLGVPLAIKNRPNWGGSVVALPAMNTATAKMTYSRPMQAARIRFAAAV